MTTPTSTALLHSGLTPSDLKIAPKQHSMSGDALGPSLTSGAASYEVHVIQHKAGSSTGDPSPAGADAAPKTDHPPRQTAKQELIDCLWAWLPTVITFFNARYAEQDVEEAIAEALCKAAGLIKSGEAGTMTSPERRGWFWITVRNAILTHLRRATRVTFVALVEDERPVPAPAESPGIDFDERDLLHDAVKKLKGPQQDAVIYHYFEGLTVTEVAAKLGKECDATRRLLKKAMGRLRELLSASLEK